jgi:glycosyltransferase involved in cell wall biosynthesis
VPWGWIKQRPHFLAEHLSRSFKVDVYTAPSYGPKALVRNEMARELTPGRLRCLPLRRFKVIQWINRILLAGQLKSLARRYDIVWITHPSLFEGIGPGSGNAQKIIYDCMDDVLAFPATLRDPKAGPQLAARERALLKAADLVFTSSENLRDKITARGAEPSRVHVINNAMECRTGQRPPATIPPAIDALLDTDRKTILYCGTISSWLDFDLVLQGLERFPATQFLLLGPAEIPVPSHPRLHHLGPVEHPLVMPLLQRADLLVMPFLVNDLILSVDPVKLYEYIASGTPTACIAYPETRKFQPFAHLYEDVHGYLEILGRLCGGTLPPGLDRAQVQAFVQRNTWASRCQEIVGLIGSS